jgi:hypothetical protein
VRNAAAVAARPLKMVEIENCVLSDVFFVVKDVNEESGMPKSTGWKCMMGC